MQSSTEQETQLEIKEHEVSLNSQTPVIHLYPLQDYNIWVHTSSGANFVYDTQTKEKQNLLKISPYISNLNLLNYNTISYLDIKDSKIMHQCIIENESNAFEVDLPTSQSVNTPDKMDPFRLHILVEQQTQTIAFPNSEFLVICESRTGQQPSLIQHFLTVYKNPSKILNYVHQCPSQCILQTLDLTQTLILYPNCLTNLPLEFIVWPLKTHKTPILIKNQIPLYTTLVSVMSLEQAQKWLPSYFQNSNPNTPEKQQGNQISPIVFIENQSFKEGSFVRIWEQMKPQNHTFSINDQNIDEIKTGGVIREGGFIKVQDKRHELMKNELSIEARGQYGLIWQRGDTNEDEIRFQTFEINMQYHEKSIYSEEDQEMEEEGEVESAQKIICGDQRDQMEIQDNLSNISRDIQENKENMDKPYVV